MKPRLTNKVLRGLLSLVAYASAGTLEDIGLQTADEWDEVKRADEWVRAMIEFRQEKKK